MLSNSPEEKINNDLNNLSASIGERVENYIVFIGDQNCWSFKTNDPIWAEYVCRRYILEKEGRFINNLKEDE